MKLLWKACVFLLWSISCTRESISPQYGDYPKEIGELLVLKCANTGCHNSNSSEAASGLDLSTWNNLFKGSRTGSPVIPYASKFSSLCYFINSNPKWGPVASPRMPLNQPSLSEAEVMAVKKWIDAGAPDVQGRVAFSNFKNAAAYIVNQGCDVVTLVDRTTGLPIRYIEVGNKPGPDIPHQVQVSPDGQYWYVLFVNNSVLQKYSTQDNRLLAEIPLSPEGIQALDWNTLTFNSDGTRAYAVSWANDGKVAALDLKNNRLLHFIGGLYQPHGIALSPDQQTLLITAQTGNALYSMDTALKDYRELSLDVSNFSLDPHDLRFHPDGHEVWITCQKSNEVRVFEWPQWVLKKCIPVGQYPQEITYSRQTESFYITCSNDPSGNNNQLGSVYKIQDKTFSVQKQFVGFQPHGIVADDRYGVIWVLSRNISSAGPAPHHQAQCTGRNGFLNAIDLQSFSPKRFRSELSVDPYYISISP